MKTASATAATRAAITGTVAALSDRELLAQTSNLARVERHLQGAIIDHLTEIEARGLFLRRGYSSLFEYAVRELGYSDAAAGRRIAAMRLCADNPHTRERLRDGSLSLSAAAELQWAFDRSRAPARQRPLRAEGAHRRGVSAGPGAAYGLAVARGPAYDGGTTRRPAGAGGAGPPRPKPTAPAHRQSTGRRARRANSGGEAGDGPPDRLPGRREGRPSRPPTPPCVRDRTRRFKRTAAGSEVD